MLLAANYTLNQGCGVGVGGVACFQLESESVFQTARVRVGFSKLLESESEHLLQLPTPMFIK